jgi:cytochrome c biogenesis protein CcmG/thiol:disulfide interchange protein DsbE
MRRSCLIIVLSLVTFFAKAQDSKKGIEKVLGEQKIPEVTLSDIDGKKINVADLGKTGKITVFSFWATWCIPCKKELTNIADLYEEWQKKYNVQIVAVSIDDSRSAGKVKPYIESQRWTYQVLLDVNQDLKRAFDIQSVPFTVIVDATGKVVSNHSGYIEGDEFVVEEELQKLTKK